MILCYDKFTYLKYIGSIKIYEKQKLLLKNYLMANIETCLKKQFNKLKKN